MRARWAILLVLLAAPAAAQGSRTDQVRAILDRTFEPDGPGAIVVVARRGEVLLQETAGLADLESRRKITPQSVFNLASVSKQFTATAVLILAERGKLSLDDDVRRHVPELPEYDPARPIRIRHLLTMTSGLPDYYRLLKSWDGVSNETAAKLIAGEQLQFPTGTKYVYSNSDYTMLGLIVQRVAGKPFPDFVREAIFEPCGMTRSRLFTAVPHETEGRVTGYRKTSEGWRESRLDRLVVGAGNLYSTAEDLLKWDAALRDGKLLKAESWKQAWERGVLEDGKPTGYGFGWMIAGDGDEKVVRHSGSWSGTNTYFSRRLASGLSVIVLSNHEKVGADKLGAQVEKLFLEDR
jgi:CubicO group peptidase (beta-lactamase class C family)